MNLWSATSVLTMLAPVILKLANILTSASLVLTSQVRAGDMSSLALIALRAAELVLRRHCDDVQKV